MKKFSKEELEVLSKFNQTTEIFPSVKSLTALFEQQVEISGEAIALVYEGVQLNYRELNKRSNKVAWWLIKNGVKPDDSVGVCANRSVELVVVILGILKAGGGYVPFDPAYPADRITYMIKESGIKTVLIQQEFSALFSNTAIQFQNIDNTKEFEDFPNENPEINIDPNGLAYILFTSGSTGMPKGVAMGQHALINLIFWQKEITGLGNAARTLQFAPISFDVSFQEIFTTFSTGGTLFMISDELRLNAIKLLEFIEEHKIERLFLPFIALQLLAEVADKNMLYPPSLRDVITAGEQLQVTRSITSFFKQLKDCRLHNHYGPTETHVITAYTLDEDSLKWVTLPPIGKPVSNTFIYLLDDNLNPVAIGVEGSIYVAGAALARGYINRPELTEERFLINPADNTTRMYKTGDIGKYLPDGNIEYLGRSDNQVKVRGYRIEPGEIEVVLSHLKGIREVAVILREDEPGDKRLVAYVVFNEKEQLTVTDIRKFAAAELPDYMMPSSFVFLDRLPKTPSGKTDRRSLPAPGTSRPVTGSLLVNPESEEEKIMASLWKTILKIDQIGIDDNFFELGGNSLLALQFIARLRQENKMDLPVVKLYQYPTIRGINRVLSGKESVKSAFENARERFADIGKGVTNKKTVEDGIAIIGMAGRFPGAKNVEQFWNNLVEGKETVSFFKDSEIDPSIDDAIKNDSSYVKARGIIEDADKFDASFFNINPRLAELMDPQQRIFMEVCWEALENSGYAANNYDGLIGVYSGMGNNTYYQKNVQHHTEAIEKTGAFQVMVANEKDYIATRISHVMNLKGPGLSINTACSTSLTAIALACQGLWNKQCDMALSGGIALTSPVKSGHLYQEGGMFSEDGHTRPFDADAKGTIFSDGAGVVVLKRFRDAVNNGDTIYAVIRGVGLNNDGAEKASFTAPSVDGQANVIALAQADANVNPDSITYVETHGTATPLGDPIEMEGLTQAFRGGTDRVGFCAIGSVKSNFGHLTSAAGVAGLIKTALALHNKLIPASLNFKNPNPAINFETSPFYVNDKNSNWESNAIPRRAGVSSFGVGGTNAHLIIEEAPLQINSGISRPKQLLLISARSNETLSKAVSGLNDFLKIHPQTNIADAAFTLQQGRVSFMHRRYVVCDDVNNCILELEEKNPGRSGTGVIQTPATGVAFMFPGQGSQYVNMGLNLYRDEVIFRDAVNKCSEILKNQLGEDLISILYPVIGQEEIASKKLQQTAYTQPALFTIGYALSQLWISWGIKPAALIGHSIGEFAAACIAGIFSLEDALMLVAARGKLMNALPPGVMYSVRMPASELQLLLNDEVSIAAINGESLSVISGNENSVEKIIKQLEKKEIVYKKLLTSHAFHSPMMDSVIAPFKNILSSVKLNPPAIPVVSTATALWLTNEQATDPSYWANHLRLPVRFAAGIKAIWNSYPKMFLLETGPRNTASILAKQQATDVKIQFAVPSLPDNSENNADWTCILNAIGQLWLSGIKINWNNFYARENRKHIALSTYPFEKKRYWLEGVNSGAKTFHSNNPFQIEIPSDGKMNDENINTIINKTNMSSRKDRLITELRNVMEDASGIDLSTADDSSSFMELGMDSLFLTQAALTISKKYASKITFRQLNEKLSTLDSLAKYLDEILPAEVVSPTITQLSRIENQDNEITSSIKGAANSETLQWLITQQMQMMQQQLAMVSSLNAPVFVPAPVNPATTAHATPVEINENEKAELSKPFGAIARIEKSTNTILTDLQKKWLADFIASYNSKTEKSKQYTQDNRKHLADPRVVTGFKPDMKELIYQVVVDRSNGCRVYDIDGNEYVDVLNGFGSNFLGYNSPIVMKAVTEQLTKGIELGPQHPLAGEVAKLICDFTGYDRAGFCNTGSEAVLGAMRIARTVTGRNLIVCFNGSYHGINDEVIVRGTKKLKSFPAAAGIMPEAVQNMLVLDYGTDEALEIIKLRASEIAAVLVEPIQSRRADFTPFEFISKLRDITSQTGSLLIFDEVITGFRLLPGGAQQYYNVKADLGTYGKVIGGGMPIGVIAGKKEFMDSLDGGFWQFGDDSVPEVGVTYFAGTFVRHPLALAAAKAVLLHLKERGNEIYDKLNGFTSKLVSEVNEHSKKVHCTFHLVNFGSLFKLKWDVEQPYSELIFLLLRQKGVHIYDGFPCFLTDAFTSSDVDFVIKNFIISIDELQAAGFLHSPVKQEENKFAANGLNKPPISGARLGKDLDGNPGWFIPDPDRPGKFKQVVSKN